MDQPKPKLKLFELAKRVSLKSPSRFKLGCILVDKSRVVSVGFNNMHKSHPKIKTYGNFIHAETHCLLGLSYQETKGKTLYVYRADRWGNTANSKPCPVCYETMKIAGIKHLFYSIKGDVYGYENLWK